jgi:hypothetical protein
LHICQICSEFSKDLMAAVLVNVPKIIMMLCIPNGTCESTGENRLDVYFECHRPDSIPLVNNAIDIKQITVTFQNSQLVQHMDAWRLRHRASRAMQLSRQLACFWQK